MRAARGRARSPRRERACSPPQSSRAGRWWQDAEEALQARQAARAPQHPRRAKLSPGSRSPGASARTGFRTSRHPRSVAKQSGWARRELCSRPRSSPPRARVSACYRRALPGPEPPSGQAQSRMLEVSECMRKHGIPGFPDPTTSPPSNPGNSGILGNGGYYLTIPKSIDTNSPAFEQAAATCNLR